MVDLLNRELNKFDLILCMPLYSRLKDAVLGIVIDTDKDRVFIESGVIKQKTVYKVNPNVDENQIRDNLISSYNLYNTMNKNKGAIELIPGGIYRGETDKTTYLYLGEYKIDIKVIYQGNESTKSSKKKPIFLCIKNSASAFDRDYLNRILESGYVDISDLINLIKINMSYCGEIPSLVSVKSRITRQIGKVQINNLSDIIKFDKSGYGNYRKFYVTLTINV